MISKNALKLLLASVGFLFFFDNCFHNTDTKDNYITGNKDSVNVDSIIHIEISAVGDLMCHSTQYNYARIDGDSFNFFPSFEKVLPYLQQSDLMMGNLETTLAGTSIPYSGYPQFNSPDAYAEALKKAGFDFIFTSNNHSNDTGEKGILRTIEQLDKYNLHHAGTYRSREDRDSIRILNIKGLNICLLSYTFSTNGLNLPADKNYLVNYCDSSLIKKDILTAREKECDLVLVYFHFGDEYERSPNLYQKNYVDWTIRCGADIILGSHPHVIQPVNFYKTQNATLDTGFVAYSLGNFLSNQKDEFTDEGIILKIHLAYTLSDKKIWIEKVEYIPTWVYRGTNAEKKLHIIFPALNFSLSTGDNYIGEHEFEEIKAARNNTADVMQKFTSKVKMVGN